MVPFPTVLQVSNDGGGGLSVCAAAGWTATKVKATRDSSRTKRQQAIRIGFIGKLLFFLLLSERKRGKTRLDFSNPFICVSPHYLNDTNTSREKRCAPGFESALFRGEDAARPAPEFAKGSGS